VYEQRAALLTAQRPTPSAPACCGARGAGGDAVVRARPRARERAARAERGAALRVRLGDDLDRVVVVRLGVGLGLVLRGAGFNICREESVLVRMNAQTGGQAGPRALPPWRAASRRSIAAARSSRAFLLCPP
jgi:hypothetical protein